MKRPLIVLLFFLFAGRLVSQTTASVTLLSVNDGLSQGMVFDILQSRAGFIWIATKDGLNRYDGVRFKAFSPDPFNPFAIGKSEVHSLFEDSRGWIWIQFPEGIDVLDPVSGRFFHLLHEGNPFTGITYETRFEETPDGTIWFSTTDQIWKISPPKDMLAKAAKQGNANIELPCQPIRMSAVSGWSGGQLRGGILLFTQKQKLLVGTNNGLFRLDPSTGQLSPELPIPDFQVRLIEESPNGALMVKGVKEVKFEQYVRQWIWITDSDTQYYTHTSVPNFASGFGFDPAGFIWTCQDRRIQKWRVPAFFNHEKPELQIKVDSTISFDGANCSRFIFDKSGVCWVGTNGFGIFKINQKIPKFKLRLPQSSQRLLLEAPDGGFFNLETPRIKYPSIAFENEVVQRDFYTDLPFDQISQGRLAVCFDKAGNGWSFYRDKALLYRMDALTKVLKSFSWQGYGLLLDRNGNLLSVSLTGLHKFDPRKETSVEFPFGKPHEKASEYSRFLFEDSEGTIWIFGFEGLTKAVPTATGYRYEYFTNNPKDRSSLSSDVVLSVADDPLEPGRYLWVGTKSGGLNRLDKKTGKFRQYKTEQGLPDNVIYGVLAENPSGTGGSAGRHIWLSTNKGLCRFDVRTERTKNFKASDGLQDNEFNSSSYLKTRDGTMIFGGVKGLTVFHPDSLRFNEHQPQIRIVGLQVNNQPFDISGKSSITLSHDQNLLTFDFAALEFTNPAQNQYRYQLVGVDKDWVALGNKNSLQFANLAPGDYTFKAEGSNNDGAWSEQPAELRFTIRPPWWISWWAYAAYIAMAFTGGGLFYRHRLRQKLEHQETLRLRELDDFKSQFFTNITHEFRTPLTVILGMTEQLAVGSEQWAVSSERPAVRKKLGLVKRNGENLLRLINQILDLAKLESNTLKINYIQGDILTFIRYIAESLHSLANAQNLMLRVESEQAKIVMDYDRDRFLQIIHNLLSNAIKFTPSGGKVVLRVDLKDKWLHISVADTGAGIPPEELPHLFERFFQAKNQEHARAGGTGIGLSLTRELVKAMNGEISVESTVGAGSTFFVKLPVTNNSAFEEKTMPIEGGIYSLPVKRTPERDQATPDQSVTAQTVLLIEDNPDVVEYLSACLQGKFHLDFAYNGYAGIEKALENVPDLIVSDVMMPIKDGFEVVETLKNDERTSHIPIILLTAKADVESRIKGLRRGADAYLSKPFHQEELLATLENLLEQRRRLQGKFLRWQFTVGSQQPTTDTQLPTEELQTAELDLEDTFLQKFRSIVEENLSDPDFEMPQLERALGMSRSQIFRKVKALTGKSPSLFIRSIRLHHGRHLLKTSSLTVSEIAYHVGYSALNNFSDAFLEEFGERPKKVRG